ncbi:SpoIIE family protein phosphatase [Paenibacillus chartarius]|uniref:SpoIIE family protein phosphatase n=1 Tax=Paenibacillus chartarius TaxID=747481 RepID=A0ABV6DJF5_9BACL
MMNNESTLLERLKHDRSAVRVLIFASAAIVFSMLLIGTIVYTLVEKQAVRKLKEQDLTTIAQAMASKVEGRLQRARETAVLLADDPAVIEWVAGGEQDGRLGSYAKERLYSLAHDYDYKNSFIVSAVSNQYWAESKQVIDYMSKDNPRHVWFYNMLSGGKKVAVQIDSNDIRGQTFVFFNVLMGSPDKPLGVAGVGLSLEDVAKEFQSFKYGTSTHVMLIDAAGTVLLSDRLESDYTKLEKHMPRDMAQTVLSRFHDDTQVLEFTGETGELTDLISYPLRSGDLRVVFTIERAETIAFLQTIKAQTVMATVVTLIVIIVLFFYISRRIFNPYKRALQLNEELEKEVAERTKQLAEQNGRILDSIDYAKRIQTSLLPSEEQMRRLFPQHFVIWKPVEAVGGDFYWIAETPSGVRLAAVGDCTGHGVPGAFMTMLAVTLLNRIVENEAIDDPGMILTRLNVLLKETLKQQDGGSGAGLSDDGLDIGLVGFGGGLVRFAGAKCSLYVIGEGGGEVRMIKGDAKRIGYRRTPDHYTFEVKELSAGSRDTLYMTTDGYLDQNGGDNNYSYGRKRFVELIAAAAGDGMELEEQRRFFEAAMREYMGDAEQRDDWMVVGLRV